ncbi:MAG: 16S rRNA (cytidine(1402)-2'-O)-methyltransferase [Firmicutes bacterium]|nr:16S rRNA (cytidine(1402)-2'-O)-methyltransferase [Bacillota bacterium]
MPGTLYLCATPIGNLEDTTARVLRILKEVDLIAAEDTRHTRRLLNHYEIKQPLTSFHLHSRQQKLDELVAKLAEGQSIALVSDAGSPGVSDPGEDLVARAVEAGIQVVAVPGPSAVIAALTVSGFDTRRFVFEGFLPRNRAEKARRLKAMADEPRTIVCFEAPHRLLGTLEAMLEVWGKRRVLVARELTKKFEELVRGDLAEAVQHFHLNPPRGEITLVIEGAAGGPVEDPGDETTGPEAVKLALAQVAELVSQGMPSGEALKKVAAERRLVKRDLYREWNKCRNL